MKQLWVPFALLPGAAKSPALAWQRDVLFTIGDDGHWTQIEAQIKRSDAIAAGAECVNQPAIAPLVNAHSHAFQRAFAGFAERRALTDDDFWSWRDRMYRVALAIDPLQLKAIAKHLYVELLRGGYTHVCEFHYVHHDKNGNAYADPYAMSVALIEAANEAGIGLTLLPVVYERAGFDAPTLREDQRRFRANAEWVLAAQRELEGYRAMYGESSVVIGASLHSLRATTSDAIAKILNEASGPIHIHVAEQAAEVHACVRATGHRPIDYFCKQLQNCAHHLIGANVIHGTHSTLNEINRLAQLKCRLVICPTTEANLGDGLTDVAASLDAGVGLAVGSDSHVCRDWREELRWLEYGQRLRREKRNVLASPGAREASTAMRMYGAVLHGGAGAAGFNTWGFVVGARADVLLIDMNDMAMAGVPIEYALDALIFSSPSTPFFAVMKSGEWVVRNGEHPGAREIANAFNEAMQSIHHDELQAHTMRNI